MQPREFDSGFAVPPSLALSELGKKQTIGG
ncbi:hypothetical protein ABIF65_005422 [Bradyrhizobium japonicum]|nr:hypothetical protein [Bradyrhizobium japonicum]MCP1861471.1 hypothetical protein [Bradyrhizobium japonicum]MCP1892231.1 hypothetical protein [Bradyrhizobium japonicum]MCW2325353.1 hypothetical protein [Bradyrhizobium japonicum]